MGKMFGGDQSHSELNILEQLVSCGGQPFLDTLAEVQFTVCLNGAHIYNTTLAMKPVPVHSSDPEAAVIFSVAARTYCLAEECLQPGFWRPGYTWRPSNTQLAKLRYRQTVYLRLEDDVSKMQLAIMAIKEAMDLLPHDKSISDEAAKVVR
jgi:hypothetical protein